MRWNQRQVKILYKVFKDLVKGDTVIIYARISKVAIRCVVKEYSIGKLCFVNGDSIFINETSHKSNFSNTFGCSTYSCEEAFIKSEKYAECKTIATLSDGEKFQEALSRVLLRRCE